MLYHRLVCTLVQVTKATRVSITKKEKGHCHFVYFLVLTNPQ